MNPESKEHEVMYQLGNHAIARAIIDCGANVVAGYPGTPSSEIIEHLAALKPGFHIEWSVNEKSALEVAIGAAWSGGRSVVTMKHVGLNVASDPFMTLAYTGVKGGMVIISADDPGCHSSQNEQDNRRYAAFAQIPCLEPATPQEAYDMLFYAFRISEELEIPVLLRPTTRVCHAKSDFRPGNPVKTVQNIHFNKNPMQWVMLPAHARVRHRVLIEKQAAIAAALGSSKWNVLDMVEEAELGVIASGVSYLYAREALERLGIRASLLKISTYPVPEPLIKQMLDSAGKILVIEELEPVVEEAVRSMLQGFEGQIHGKDIVPRYGELNVSIVETAIAAAAGKAHTPYITKKISLDLPDRPPVMCPGCPHRATYHAMKKAFGKDAIFPGDIGCYTLGVQMGTMDTCLCMGASITTASGIYHAKETGPICCSIGDSTFLHTGIPGLLNAVYNGADITVAILDNRTTAMTGHQPHPGTGLNALGDATFRASLADICRACGVEFVKITDPFDVKNTIDIFKQARSHKGTSVVISEQECIITARRHGNKHAPVRVDRELCTGCKVCVNFGCPAISFSGDAGQKGRAEIGELCAGCSVCAQLCPSRAIREVPG